MKTIIMSLLFLFAATAFANPKLKQFMTHSTLMIDGKIISSPGLAVLEGESASISQSSIDDNNVQQKDLELRIDISPSRDSKNIMAKYNLYHYSKDTKTIFRINPRFIVEPNKDFLLYLGKDDEGHEYELRVKIEAI